MRHREGRAENKASTNIHSNRKHSSSLPYAVVVVFQMKNIIRNQFAFFKAPPGVLTRSSLHETLAFLLLFLFSLACSSRPVFLFVALPYIPSMVEDKYLWLMVNCNSFLMLPVSITVLLSSFFPSALFNCVFIVQLLKQLLLEFCVPGGGSF